MKRIVLTGGGTAGHVTPNLALIPFLLQDGWDVHYFGTADGIERQLLTYEKQVTYHTISSGKLRRYMDIRNFTDPIKVVHGVGQSITIIKKLQPQLIFSKGGFVSVPVVIGGWVNQVPAIIHESDFSPGLANKIAIPFAKKICTTFPETVGMLKKGKAIYTGTPIREEILHGNAHKGRMLCGFIPSKPVVLVMGGSLGAIAINKILRKSLHRLTNQFQFVHICGQGNIDPAYHEVPGYKQFEYIREDLPDIMAMAEIIVSRAGSNSICEFLAMRKPSLLIPLPLSSSRGDQILNAQSFQKQGFSKVLFQEKLTEDSFCHSLQDLFQNRTSYVQTMQKENHTNGTQQILEIIRTYPQSSKDASSH